MEHIITTVKALNLHSHNNAFKNSGTRYACLHIAKTLKFTVFIRTIPIVCDDEERHKRSIRHLTP